MDSPFFWILLGFALGVIALSAGRGAPPSQQPAVFMVAQPGRETLEGGGCSSILIAFLMLMGLLFLLFLWINS